MRDVTCLTFAVPLNYKMLVYVFQILLHMVGVGGWCIIKDTLFSFVLFIIDCTFQAWQTFLSTPNAILSTICFWETRSSWHRFSSALTWLSGFTSRTTLFLYTVARRLTMVSRGSQASWLRSSSRAPSTPPWGRAGKTWWGAACRCSCTAARASPGPTSATTTTVRCEWVSPG